MLLHFWQPQNGGFRGISVSVPLFPPNISYELAWDRTELSAVKCRPQQWSENVQFLITIIMNAWRFPHHEGLQPSESVLGLSKPITSKPLRGTRTWNKACVQTFLGDLLFPSYLFSATVCLLSLRTVFTFIDSVSTANISSYNTQFNSPGLTEFTHRFALSYVRFC
jgi:hypothetical protein